MTGKSKTTKKEDMNPQATYNVAKEAYRVSKTDKNRKALLKAHTNLHG